MEKSADDKKRILRKLIEEYLKVLAVQIDADAAVSAAQKRVQSAVIEKEQIKRDIEGHMSSELRRKVFIIDDKVVTVAWDSNAGVRITTDIPE